MTIARALSQVFLAGTLEVDGLVDRGARMLGKRWRWLRPLARRVCRAFPDRPSPRVFELTLYVWSDKGFSRAYQAHELELVLSNRLTDTPRMMPLPAAAGWKVPEICKPSELADWLGITVSELEWFADLGNLQCKCTADRLRHYRYRLLLKTDGQPRLVEAPKLRLKQLQRRILFDLLAHIPQHSAAHGFRAGRSILTFAAPHVGRRVVLRIDLRNFFPSISRARIRGLFQTAGYPESVAALLAGLCTSATPLDIWTGTPADSSSRAMCELRRLYAKPHLPQGSPTSPALANLCAYRLDCRLAALAKSANAIYTRYADDLAFSGEAAFARIVKRFQIHA